MLAILLWSFVVYFTCVCLLWLTSGCFSAPLWLFLAQKHSEHLFLADYLPPSQVCADRPAQVCASYVVPQEQTRTCSSWSSPSCWAQRWAPRVSDWLPSRHFYCGLSDGFRVAGPLLPTPNPKWISSLARGWKESDWVISSSGNSPWQQFKAAWKTGQQVAAIWISKASQTRKGNENQKKQGW